MPRLIFSAVAREEVVGIRRGLDVGSLTTDDGVFLAECASAWRGPAAGHLLHSCLLVGSTSAPLKAGMAGGCASAARRILCSCFLQGSTSAFPTAGT